MVAEVSRRVALSAAGSSLGLLLLGAAPATAAPPPGSDPATVAAQCRSMRPTVCGMNLPGVRTTLLRAVGDQGTPRVALTFDACGGRGGSGYDQTLVDGLRARRVPATLFLNARWIGANQQIAQGLAADPLFEIGNHGTRHVPLTVGGQSAYGIRGTRSVEEAVAEVWQSHVLLTGLLGAPPRLFRAGTAHYDDVGVRIVQMLGEVPVGFSVNGDAGATLPAGRVRSGMDAVRPGGIILAHLNRPAGGTAQGTLGAVDDLLARKYEFTHIDL